MNRDDIAKIKDLNLTEVDVRSTLTCELEYGICQKCYGWAAMTTQKLVDIGEAIGTIAAQSIGEPGTQLTMRTFHTGGVFKGAGAMKQVLAPFDGKVSGAVRTREMRTRHGDVVQVAIKEADIEFKGAKESEKIHIPAGAKVMFVDGAEFKKAKNC